MQSAIFVFLALTTGLAALIDLRERRLPNRLTVPGICMGLALAATTGSDMAWVSTWLLLVLLHIAFVVIPPYGLGGGDWKLVAALSPSAILGGWLFLWLSVSYLLAAGHGVALKSRGRLGGIPLGPWLWLPWFSFGMGDFAHVAMANCW